MKHTIKYLAVISSAVLFTAACSEGDVTIDDNLSGPEYVLPQGETGSLDALVYEFHERYGSYILYDFKESDIRWEWTTTWRNEYRPVLPGNEKYVLRMLKFLQESFFDNFTDNFIRLNLKYQVFMVDSVSSSSLTIKWVNLTEKGDGMVLAGCGVQMDGFNDSKWNEIKMNVEETFIGGLYKATAIKPTAFEALRFTPIVFSQIDDPLGEYTAYQHSAYTVGYVMGRFTSGMVSPTSLIPLVDQDFKDFIIFLIQNTKTELTHVLGKYPKMKERAIALVPFLSNVIELDVVATQNRNCPQDPIPANFFTTL